LIYFRPLMISVEYFSDQFLTIRRAGYADSPWFTHKPPSLKNRKLPFASNTIPLPSSTSSGGNRSKWTWVSISRQGGFAFRPILMFSDQVPQFLSIVCLPLLFLHLF